MVGRIVRPIEGAAILGAENRQTINHIPNPTSKDQSRPNNVSSTKKGKMYETQHGRYITTLMRDTGFNETLCNEGKGNPHLQDKSCYSSGTALRGYKNNNFISLYHFKLPGASQCKKESGKPKDLGRNLPLGWLLALRIRSVPSRGISRWPVRRGRRVLRPLRVPAVPCGI